MQLLSERHWIGGCCYSSLALCPLTFHCFSGCRSPHSPFSAPKIALQACAALVLNNRHFYFCCCVLFLVMYLGYSMLCCLVTGSAVPLPQVLLFAISVFRLHKYIVYVFISIPLCLIRERSWTITDSKIENVQNEMPCRIIILYAYYYGIWIVCHIIEEFRREIRRRSFLSWPLILLEMCCRHFVSLWWRIQKTIDNLLEIQHVITTTSGKQRIAIFLFLSTVVQDRWATRRKMNAIACDIIQYKLNAWRWMPMPWNWKLWIVLHGQSEYWKCNSQIRERDPRDNCFSSP